MQLESLSKGYFKKIIIVLMVISIIGIAFINRSKAKYRVTQSIQIVNGEVNYKVPDLNVIAMYKQKTEGNTDDENYDSITDVPKSGYVVNADKSYCTIVGNDTKLKNKMIYNNGEISINISKKGTKCYVWLDIQKNLADIIKEQVKTEGPQPNFNNTSCKNGSNTFVDNKNCGEETNGLYEAQDVSGKSYYFRGTVDNNWVKFGNFYWRIIRFNGNGSIRLIYNGTTAGATSSNAQIGTSRFSIDSNTYDDNAYVGYKYGSKGQSQSENGYNATHKNTNDSGIKKVVDDWYEKTFSVQKNNGKSVTEYIDINAGFCGDRSPYQLSGASASSQPSKANYGTGKTLTYYGARIREIYAYKPTYDCLYADNDLYTVEGASSGNHELTYPVGLITADEVMYAGGQSSNNRGYWLCTGENYWTMSPSSFREPNEYFAEVFFVYFGGNLNENDVNDAYGVRPVINLKADTPFKTEKEENKGTADNPFIVQ